MGQDAMTSVQTMLDWTRRARRCAGPALAALAACLGAGCLNARHDVLRPPAPVVAPYDASLGDVLIAVAPLANESGTSAVDALGVSDKLAAAAEQVEGVRCVPVNRTLAAMESLGIRSVRDPGDARRLATAMGVDGVVVGTITAYDPYDPPTLGLALALFARTGAMHAPEPETALDTRDLSGAPTDTTPDERTSFGDRPASVVSAHLDAKNHGVLESLRNYAEGRHDESSAMGWKRYLASMDLYTEFAAQYMFRRLMEQESARIGVATEEPDKP